MSLSMGQSSVAAKDQTVAPPAPDKILQIGLGFWGSKALLSAVELGLFTHLAKGPLSGDALAKQLPLVAAVGAGSARVPSSM